jgi:hypothetical protein
MRALLSRSRLAGLRALPGRPRARRPLATAATMDADGLRSCKLEGCSKDTPLLPPEEVRGAGRGARARARGASGAVPVPASAERRWRAAAGCVCSRPCPACSPLRSDWEGGAAAAAARFRGASPTRRLRPSGPRPRPRPPITDQRPAAAHPRVAAGGRRPQHQPQVHSQKLCSGCAVGADALAAAPPPQPPPPSPGPPYRRALSHSSTLKHPLPPPRPPAVDFVNKLMPVVEAEGHHPDLHITNWRCGPGWRGMGWFCSRHGGVRQAPLSNPPPRPSPATCAASPAPLRAARAPHPAAQGCGGGSDHPRHRGPLDE